MGSKNYKLSFLKYDELIKAIQHIESLDLANTSDNTLIELFRNTIRIIPYTSAFVPIDSLLYRARINENDKPFEEVGQISMKKKEAITEYGRANRPKEQVFYAGVNCQLAIKEITNKLSLDELKGKTATVGVWRVKNKIHVSNIIYSRKLHDIRKDINDAYLDNQKILKINNDLNTIDSSNLVTQFFSDHFTNENIKTQYDYKISALYTSLLKSMNFLIVDKYGDERFEGINYPSVAMKFKGDNVAIFGETIKYKIELVSVLNINCEDLLILDKTNKISNEIIDWK